MEEDKIADIQARFLRDLKALSEEEFYYVMQVFEHEKKHRQALKALKNDSE